MFRVALKSVRWVGRQARELAFYGCMLGFGLVIAPMTAMATDPPAVTLPDVGVDMEGTVDAAFEGLGPVVLKIVLGFVAFLVIKFGMKWFRRLT